MPKPAIQTTYPAATVTLHRGPPSPNPPERLSIPLDGETARGLLQVDPESQPTSD